jgi:hypothetical protein
VQDRLFVRANNVMKKRIKYLIGLAQDKAPIQPIPEPVPERVIAGVVEDINNGKVWLVKECAERWRCSTDRVIKTIKNEPGVFRVGSDYRIPQSVYQRILQRMMCLQ